MNRLFAPLLLAVAAVMFASATPADAEVHVNLQVSPRYAHPVEPVTSGVPFAEGALRNVADLRLNGPDGPVPLQARQLSAWPDGSVRWALLDFQATPGVDGDWTLASESGPAPEPSTTVTVDESDDGFRVDTGPLQFTVSRVRLSGLENVVLNGKTIVDANHGGGITIDAGDGRHDLGSLTPDDVTIEEAGPLRTVIRARGHHVSPDGIRFDFIFRIYACAGVPWVRIQHTFTNPTDRIVRLSELVLDLPLAISVDQYVLGGDDDGHVSGDVGSGIGLVQSPNHPVQNFDKHVFTVSESGTEVASGSRAAGWIALSGPDASVAVVVRDFWELYPKGFRASQDRLSIDLWPQGALPTPAGHMDVNAGAARTHEIILSFGAEPLDTPAVQDLLGRLEQPPMAFATPEYYASTNAVASGQIAPAVIDGKTVHPDYEAFVEWMLTERYRPIREELDEYGVMHFGDYLLSNTVWNCLQYELPRSFTQQFFRTGDRRFFDHAGEMVRAQRDIMVLYHHPVEQGNRAQRSYAGNPREGEPHGKQSGGEAMLHIGGVVDYYLLTGDWRTHDAILWMADGLANVTDNLVWFTPHGLGWRAAGYPIKVLAEAYKLTGDDRYRKQAVRIMEENVFPRAHTVENGYDPSIADGVWWADVEELRERRRRRGGSSRSELPEEGWMNQAWMVDQMGDAFYSLYAILDDGPLRERTRSTFLDVADWAVKRVWRPDAGGLVVRYLKLPDGTYTEQGGTYDGFIVNLAVSTTARAYLLTGEDKYLATARDIFTTAVRDGRRGVNCGKQIGQAMQYTPIYLAIEAGMKEE